MRRRCAGRSTTARSCLSIGAVLSRSRVGLLTPRLGSEFLPALEEGNLWIRASMPPTIGLEAGEPVTAKMREILLRHPEVHHRRFSAWPAGQRQRRVAVLQCRAVRAAESHSTNGRRGLTKDMLIDAVAAGIRRRTAGHRLQFLPVHPGQYRGGAFRRQRRQLGQDHRPRLADDSSGLPPRSCSKWSR